MTENRQHEVDDKILLEMILLNGNDALAPKRCLTSTSSPDETFVARTSIVLITSV